MVFHHNCQAEVAGAADLLLDYRRSYMRMQINPATDVTYYEEPTHGDRENLCMPLMQLLECSSQWCMPAIASRSGTS